MIMRQASILVALAAMLASRTAFGAEPLTPVQAATKEGTKVTVGFTVKGVGVNSTDDYEELYSEKSWDVPDCFFLRFPKGTMKQIQATKKPSLEYYYGDTVQATGTVEKLDFGCAGKRAVIYIDELAQLQAVPATPSF